MTASGEFILFSFAVPTLPADKYRLTATQQMTQPSGGVPGFTVDPRESFFEVTAPRFALPADQILSTYPPNRAAGAFSSRLPQIVLRRRTLPWERRAAANQPPEMPWLALVVLADGEGQFTSNVPVAQCVTSGVSMPGRNDVVLGDCLTVSNRIRAGAFPHMDEVGLLAHVRRVDLSDTELALGDDDGDLAVVVANRLPQPGLSYTAYLISLENQIGTLGLSSAHEDHDTAQHGAPFVPEQPFTTWPVLAHWSFACIGPGDFQSLMQEIDVGMLGTVRPPAGTTPGKPPPPARPNPPQVLPSGHLTVDHISRDGEPGEVLYRGPLLPYPGTREAPGPDGVLPLLHTSDQAREVRSDGWEDLSLATAFEIGRLLALAEPSVVAGLLLWRKQALATARQAALLAAEPQLAALGTDDVGTGFAARAGLRVLTGLGADDARRLTGRAGTVRTGPRAAADGTPLDTAPDRVAELSRDDADELAVLRAAVARAAARRDPPEGEPG
jgi:hypothetical protein